MPRKIRLEKSGHSDYCFKSESAVAEGDYYKADEIERFVRSLNALTGDLWPQNETTNVLKEIIDEEFAGVDT